MLKKPLLLLLFLCFGVKAFCAVFVVTSNADSGPGTLRDALTQAAANDSTTMDYINFNLPDLSETGRTIILYSQLPEVTSNLVIDGTTQPGAKFGISDAHVQLLYQIADSHGFSGLAIINHHDVAIYGLYINFVTSQSTYLFLFNGIQLTNDKNIQIGAAGKGNVINGFYSPLAANPPDTIHHYTPSIPFENLTIQDNFFGIAPDGETLTTNQVAGVGLGFVLKKIKIGGTPAEGNLFAQGLTISEQNDEDKTDTDPRDLFATEGANILIQNNKIGVDYNMSNGLPNSNGVMISCVDPNGHDTVTIADNVIAASNSYAIYPTNIGEKITIVRNYIGTDKTLSKSFETGGIFLYWDINQVAIGSENPADANYITNCNPVTVWPYTNATINKNSFFCEVYPQPMHYNGYGEFFLPVINILNISATSVSGTATPNSNIELFYSDACKTCSPQTYFASTTANTSGKWQYNGAITGSVIASATYNNNTSDFTRTAINTDSVKVINACSNNGTGSIIGAIPYSASIIKWLDTFGNVIGTTPNLLNVKIGKYRLLIQNGTGCSDSTSYYEIKTAFQIDSSQVVKTEPSCSNPNGSISGIFVVNNNSATTNFYWKDASGKVWGRTATLAKVPAGSYTLFISNADSTCTQTYGPITLKNSTGPNIDQSHIRIQSTNCGQATGSITNIPATGSGTLTYSWINGAQQTVSTDSILVNQPAGTYKLQITDNTQCGPVYSSDIIIPETNGITLDELKTITSPASCGKNNGAVTGISITGATQYQWLDANNNTVGTSTDLQNVASGNYTLTVSNGFGCNKTSKTYFIAQLPGTIYPNYAVSTSASCFGENNGSLTVTTDALAKTLRWVNSQNQPIGNTQQISGLAPDVYTLFLTDANGCESFYGSYNVKTAAQLQIVTESEHTTPDQCSTKTGSIDNIQVTGGIPPYSYSWTDQNNVILSSLASVNGLATGTYQLNVNDSKGCGLVTANYTVPNQDNTISPPLVNDIGLCTPGKAITGAKCGFRVWLSFV